MRTLDFINAASQGHIQEIDRLVEMYPNDIASMVRAADFQAFRDAARNGHLAVLEKLITLAPDKVQRMVSASQFYAFRWAAYYGHLAVMEKIIALAPDNVQDMIDEGLLEVFTRAAGNSHLAVMDRLMELAPDKVQDMVSADNFAAFREAAAHGQIAVMDRLMELAPDKVQDMVSAGNFAAFREAAAHGQIAVMDRLMKLAPDKVQDMVSAGNFAAFREAATHGHISVMDRLMELASDKVQDMVSANNVYAFKWAAAHGHIAVMDRLVELAPDKVQDMVSADIFAAFGEAATHVQIAVMDRLMELAPDKVQDMVSAGNFAAFRKAAAHGQIAVMDRLVELAPDKVQDMVIAGELLSRYFSYYNVIESKFYAFREAAAHGHLAVMEKLIELAPDKIEDMVSADNFASFREAAAHGHISVMDKFVELASDKVQDMVSANNFYAFQWAAAHGHLAVLDRLVELAPDKVQDMVSAYNFYAFQWAAAHGHLAVMEKIMALAPDKVQDMVSADNFAAFRMAAAHGQIAVMDRLMELAPDKVQDMVSADNFAAFREAASNGHPLVLEILMTLAPDKVQDMMSAYNFIPLMIAVEKGYFQIIEYVLSFPKVFAYLEMACNAITTQIAQESVEITPEGKILIRLVQDFIDTQLTIITREIDDFNTNHPGQVFDIIDPEKAKLYFYMLRHLIRQQTPEALNQLNLLLNIPSVRVLAHQEMTSNEPNELLLFAMSLNYQAAALRLLAIPAVYNLAVRNDFYGEEYRGFFQEFINTQLTNITQEIGDFNTNHPGQVFDITDPEKAKLYFYMLRHLIRQQTPEALNQLNLLLNIPSVRALAHQEITPNEPNELLRLAMSLNHQAAAIHLLAIPAVYNLAVRNDFYRQEQRQGLDLRTLAQNRESSMTALSQDEQNALKAVETIYQPIIDKRGVTAIMNELRDDIARRYQANPATVQTGDGREIELPLDFKDYQNLAKTLSADTRERALKSYYEDHVHTAYRYLSKPNHWMSPNAQFVNRIAEVAWSTFEGYQDLISLLYLAAKDKNTPSINEDSIEDRIHHFITELYYIGRAHNWDKTRINPSRGGVEEYDDLEGDKPSCYSGVKKRLFQSVKGHPLLLILTKDLIKQEAREMVREHFKNAINETNCEALQQAWQSVIDGNKGSRGILKQLDLSEEQVQSMLDTLHKKYGPRFDTDAQAHFLGLIQSTESSQSLAEHQGFQFHLPDILKQKAEEFQARPLPREEMVARRLRYFETQAAKNSLDETKDQEMHKKSPK